MNKSQTFYMYVRNFIFGAEDSLVSTVGLLAGIAWSGMEVRDIVVAGVVLIFVEAFSMSVGSFLSERATEEAKFNFEKRRSHSFAASIIMFFSYLICGLIPLLPYILLPIESAFFYSIIASIIALILLGIVSARILKTHQFRNASRMALLGGLAIFLGVVVGNIVK